MASPDASIGFKKNGVAAFTLHDLRRTCRTGLSALKVEPHIAELSTDIDKPLVALYAGDWDPSGKHMSDVDLPRRLEQYSANLTVRRIALLKDDLVNLPSFDPETKSQDPRYR